MELQQHDVCEYVDPHCERKCKQRATIRVGDKYGVTVYHACSKDHCNKLVTANFDLNKTIRVSYIDCKPT